MDKNLNRNKWLIYLGYVEKNKSAFVDELRSKGYALSGKESCKKITEIILGINTNKRYLRNGKGKNKTR